MIACVKCRTSKRPSKILETLYLGRGWIIQLQRCSNCGQIVRTPHKTRAPNDHHR